MCLFKKTTFIHQYKDQKPLGRYLIKTPQLYENWLLKMSQNNIQILAIFGRKNVLKNLIIEGMAKSYLYYIYIVYLVFWLQKKCI